MSVCRPPLLVPTSGDFKSAGVDDCETRGATVPTSLPLSLTIHFSSSHLPGEVKPTEQKLQWVSSAWSGLISVLFVSMFPCFLLLRGSKTVFLSSLTSHNAPAPLPMRTQPFSQQFPQRQLFFPCSPFREPIWGIEAIKPAENEK